MTMEERIQRINELYHKSKAEGLTEEEKQDVENVRANMRANLNSITIQHEDGTQEKLSEKYGKK